MGEVGPCGPCSEIHIDLRNQDEVDAIPGKELVNNDHPQVVEIWNNVFMQFERKADGSLIPLPSKHVDTGMGFERLCMAIQGKQSNYDTDVFTGTIAVIEQLSGKTYGQERWTDISMRVIADHIRAIAFAIGDGLLPSNNKAGYVIRRILRRAVRYGYTYLGFREPFLCKLIPTLSAQFDGVFPELIAQQDFVANVIREEESSFLRTLENGITRLDKVMENLADGQIDGETVFELYDTFGFPLDLTALIAREKGFSIDEAGYQKALQAQKQRSRTDAASEKSDWVELNDVERIEFVGYDETQTQTQLVKYRKVQNKQGSQYHIVLEQTPFYAESGGQVGDSGWLTLFNNGVPTIVNISDTKKENDLVIHISNDANLDAALNEAQVVTAQIDVSRRKLITNNHSVTHLMLAALRRVLGNHIIQKGSYQNEDLTRFDFSHFSKVTDEELAQAEDIVNAKIRENITLEERRNVPIKQALELGATATFGEKYGDFVRMIIYDPAYSVELCGGTHVPATGQIGLFKFVSEGSVSAGVRRVEAVTGEKALQLLREQGEVLDQLRELFKGQKDLVKSVSALMDEKLALQKRIEVLENEKLQSLKQELLSKVVAQNGHHILVSKVSVPNADALKQLAYDLKAKVDNLFCVLGAEIGGKPQLAVMIADSLVAEKQLHAGNIVKELAREIKGGGGGQPFFATAGGNDLSGLDAALEKGKHVL